MPDPVPLEKIVLPALLRTARNAYGAAIRKALADVECDDIPRNGIYVLGAISRANLPLSDIIRSMGISKQSAGQLIDTLVLRGYLTRETDPEDRRRLNLTLTERGKSAAAASAKTVDGIEVDITERLGADYIAHTRETLAAIIHAGFAVAGGSVEVREE